GRRHDRRATVSRRQSRRSHSVFVDGRRATRHRRVQAALGVIAVDIGRPFLWGLGAFGQAGVGRGLERLEGELELAMGKRGTRTVADITREYVMRIAD